MDATVKGFDITSWQGYPARQHAEGDGHQAERGIRKIVERPTSRASSRKRHGSVFEHAQEFDAFLKGAAGVVGKLIADAGIEKQWAGLRRVGKGALRAVPTFFRQTVVLTVGTQVLCPPRNLKLTPRGPWQEFVDRAAPHAGLMSSSRAFERTSDAAFPVAVAAVVTPPIWR